MSQEKNETNFGAAAPVTAPAARYSAPPQRQALRAFLDRMEWRKAFFKAEEFQQSPEYRAGEDESLCAAACELAIREMVADGKPKQAESLADRVLKRRPEWIRRWPLGLQVAVRAIPDLPERLKDADFVARLRREIHDPAELELCDYAPLRADADAILRAWERLDAADFSAARERLAAIGRRSPLSDWRLLLQAICAARRGDGIAAAQNVERLTAGTTAARMAAMLFAKQASSWPLRCTAILDGTIRRERFERVASVNTDNFNAAFDEVFALAEQLRERSCFELSSTLLLSFSAQDEDHVSETFDRLAEHLMDKDIRQFSRIDLRDVLLHYMDSPPDVLDIISIAVTDMAPFWSPREHAAIILVACGYLKSLCPMNRFGFGFLPPEFKEFATPEYIRRLAQTGLWEWPELTELYEFWIWAENEEGPGRCEGLEHWHRKDPENVAVLIRYIRRLIEGSRFKRAEDALARLAALPGDRRPWAALRGKRALLQCREAFERKQAHVLAHAVRNLDGLDPLTVAEISIMAALLREERPNNRAVLEKIAGRTANPWGLLLVAAPYLKGLGRPDFPDALQACFEADVETQYPQLMEALRHENGLCQKSCAIDIVGKFVAEFFGKLDDPQKIIEIQRFFFFVLPIETDLLVHQAVRAGITQANRRLLGMEETWQAQALLLTAATLVRFALKSSDRNRIIQASQYASVLITAALSIAENIRDAVLDIFDQILSLDRYRLTNSVKVPRDQALALARRMSQTPDDRISDLIAEYSVKWFGRPDRAPKAGKKRKRKNSKPGPIPTKGPPP